MTKKEHVQLWHKSQGRETGVNALARHGTLKGAKPVGPQAQLSSAQKFTQMLQREVKKGVASK